MPKHRILAQMLLLTLNVSLNWCKVCAVFSTTPSLLHSHRRRRNRSILWSEPSFPYGSVVGTFISNNPGCLSKRPESLFYCSVPSIPWPSSALFSGNVCFEDSFLHPIMPPYVTKLGQLLPAHLLQQPFTAYIQFLSDVFICTPLYPGDSQNPAVAFVFECCDSILVCLPQDPSLASIICYWKDAGCENSELRLLILYLPQLLHIVQSFQSHAHSTLDFLADITIALDSCTKIPKIINFLQL